MEELVELTLKEVKDIISQMPFWQQEQVLNRVKEALLLAYKEGRAEEAYRQKGPRTIRLYE